MKTLVAAIAFIISSTIFSFAQTPESTPKPTLVPPRLDRPLPIAERNNLFCAGYIQTSPIMIDFEIVGAVDEPEKYALAERNEIYISRGKNNGVILGDKFAIVRPKGQFRDSVSKKKGNLGTYFQEVGEIEIIRVKDDVSVARVTNSCDSVMFGDIIQRIPQRVSPMFRSRPALDKYAEPSGKQLGKIVMARDAREALSNEQVVYIDLGEEDNVKVGEYLTIFRPLGKGNVFNHRYDEQSINAREIGNESRAYRGGKYSILSPRKEGGYAELDLRTSKEAKKNRPNDLRKIVGEMVIIAVKERTATAVIVRNVQEIHTGDMVEVQ